MGWAGPRGYTPTLLQHRLPLHHPSPPSVPPQSPAPLSPAVPWKSEMAFPALPRRRVVVSMGLEDLFREERPLDLSDLAAALWAEPRELESAECDDFCDGLHVYPLGPCACGGLRKMRALHRPQIVATRIQALWRGYATRKKTAQMKADIDALMPHWAHFNEKYETYAIAQNLVEELKKDDPTWDATQTPYYIWMRDVGLPWLHGAEHYMRIRGWTRPQTKLNTPVLKELLVMVMMHCGFEEKDAWAIFSVVGSFKVPEEWERD